MLIRMPPLVLALHRTEGKIKKSRLKIMINNRKSPDVVFGVVDNRVHVQQWEMKITTKISPFGERKTLAQDMLCPGLRPRL